MLQEMKNLVMGYVQEHGFIPGEYLCELADELMARLSQPVEMTSKKFDEQLADVLEQLVREGKLKFHVRKRSFLHLDPTT